MRKGSWNSNYDSFKLGLPQQQEILFNCDERYVSVIISVHIIRIVGR